MLNCSFKKLQISEDYINIYKHIFNEWKCVCVCVYLWQQEMPHLLLLVVFLILRAHLVLSNLTDFTEWNCF